MWIVHNHSKAKKMWPSCAVGTAQYNINIYIYITDLVFYTNFHWFFNPECQHIFGKQTGYIFQSPKNDNMADKIETLQWINSIIRNNKCILTKLYPVFILTTAVWKNDNKQHVEPWKRLTSWGHTKVLCVCC